uniref:Uncharacterized protein n=1 Tax=Cannabis sativa TaxID=3483 RepID=A0A803PBN0_CANSA
MIKDTNGLILPNVWELDGEDTIEWSPFHLPLTKWKRRQVEAVVETRVTVNRSLPSTQVLLCRGLEKLPLENTTNLIVEKILSFLRVELAIDMNNHFVVIEKNMNMPSQCVIEECRAARCNRITSPNTTNDQLDATKHVFALGLWRLAHKSLQVLNENPCLELSVISGNSVTAFDSVTLIRRSNPDVVVSETRVERRNVIDYA